VALVVGDADETPSVPPYADRAQRGFVEGGMAVYVLPRRLQPVAVAIVRLVVRQQKAASSVEVVVACF
jgi:hypothetical protein